MQTAFSPAQLQDPDIRESEKILRTCVHCGFCTATCPTYTLLGDELDSPRGRIYLLKGMLEGGKPPTADVVKHVDRCLSCLSCMTTCPSGVNYMHLVDHGRAIIERDYRRPLKDRLLRNLLSVVLPNRGLFRLALMGAWLAKPIAPLLPAFMRPMLALAPARVPRPSATERPGIHAADGARRKRVALLPGCAQPVLGPQIHESTIRLLNRHGVEVVMPAVKGNGCCGALVHHMGKSQASHAQAAALIEAWWAETVEGGGDGLDAIVINASGCGTTIKDYGFMFREDAAMSQKAMAISALAKDITEVLADVGLQTPIIKTGQRVAYHSACSMQHGQKIKTQPRALLAKAGFIVVEVPEGHLCCGSAGVYNILQPELAGKLRDRKVANIRQAQPDIIATGNMGCMTQIGQGQPGAPIVHTVELLDWATGGPRPQGLNLC